jgi:NADH dehydrogenase (ubiquinone) 1 beta subcomplex subunit 3
MYRDPWAKYHAWRKHPLFSKRSMFSAFFPGFGIATVAFTAYVIADNLIFSKSKEIKDAEDRHREHHH